jgi:hypothetical protein
LHPYSEPFKDPQLIAVVQSTALTQSDTAVRAMRFIFFRPPLFTPVHTIG